MRLRNFLFLFFLFFTSSSVLAVIQQSEMKIFAVTSEGEGLSADLILKITEGNGKVWSSVEPLVGTTTQNAELVAVKLAKNYSSNVGKYDYLFEIKSNASVVEGPSAGSAMALLVVSALKDKKLPKEVGLTGTIAEDGSIGPVGGIFEKSKEAARIGIKLFMIPIGEARQTVKLPNGVQSIFLPDYALKEWGMKVVEVKNLDDALSLAFSDIGKIDINASQKTTELIFTPSPIKQASSLKPLQNLTKNYLAETKALIDSARNSLSTTLINDTSIINSLLSQLGDTEDALQEAQTLYDNNYLYSAANYTFLARVNALTIKDIAENPSILSDNSTILKLKVDALKEKIQNLSEELSNSVPIEGFEWFAASQQRLTWARINVERLSQPETIIIINGVQQGVSENAIKKIQDFEFAQAWFEIANNFYNFSKQSEKFAKPNDFFKQELDEFIVKAENSLSILGNENNEDIIRRLDSAKIEKELKWHLGGVFDAASAVSLIDAEKAVKDNDFNGLEKIITERINALDTEIKDLNFQPVWANLYLDHARYYLNAGKFYSENNQGSKAVEMLKSGVSLVFLAESNLKISKKAFEHYSKIDQNELVGKPFSTKTGISVTVIPKGSEFLFYLTIILAIGLVVAIILIFVIIAKHSRKNSAIALYKDFLQKQKELSKDYVEGRITAGEFLSESKKLSEQSAKVEASAISKSRHTVELDYLHSKLSALQHSIKLLKKDFNAGKILESDYYNALENIKAEMIEIQKSLNFERHFEEKKFKQEKRSKTLEEIANQVRKPAKKKVKKKNKQ